MLYEFREQLQNSGVISLDWFETLEDSELGLALFYYQLFWPLGLSSIMPSSNVNL